MTSYEGGDTVEKDGDSDIDNLDFQNFKGIYFEEDPNRKYQDPDTGCHFEYNDLIKRLKKLKSLRKRLDEQLGLPPETPSPAELDYLQNKRAAGSRDLSYDRWSQKADLYRKTDASLERRAPKAQVIKGSKGQTLKSTRKSL